MRSGGFEPQDPDAAANPLPQLQARHDADF